MDKKHYNQNTTDKIHYILEKYPKASTWSFNQFLRVYVREWMKITLPPAFDDSEAVETVRRRLQEIKVARW